MYCFPVFLWPYCIVRYIKLQLLLSFYLCVTLSIFIIFVNFFLYCSSLFPFLSFPLLWNSLFIRNYDSMGSLYEEMFSTKEADLFPLQFSWLKLNRSMWINSCFRIHPLCRWFEDNVFFTMLQCLYSPLNCKSMEWKKKTISLAKRCLCVQ